MEFLGRPEDVPATLAPAPRPKLPLRDAQVSQQTARPPLRVAAACVVLALVAVLVPVLLVAEGSCDVEQDARCFEDDIAAFEAADAASPPVPGAVVFVGSSTIRLWNTLSADMAPLRVLQRGFGGAHMSHVLYNARRSITPYSPAAVVLYAGDNDLCNTHKSAASVFAELLQLLDVVSRAGGGAVFFLAIKPSGARWGCWGEMEAANSLVAAHAATDMRLRYIDVATPMLGADGTPREELFVSDRLHLNAAGYSLWTPIVRAALANASVTTS